MGVFVVTMLNGAAYDDRRPRREQQEWDEHAAFMDALVDDGFVVLGGPLGDGTRVLLVVEGESEADVVRRLKNDPWLRDGVLQLTTLEPWTIWLDGRRASAPS
jgi:uncharacterized protein YciI